MANVAAERASKGVARENENMIWRPYGPTVLDLEHSACSGCGIMCRTSGAGH